MLKFTTALAAAVAVLLCAMLVSADGKYVIHNKLNKAVPKLSGEKLKDGNAVFGLVCQYFGSTPAAAGIMGNIEVETGGSYSYQQNQDGGGNGYGLFQFDFLKSYYFNWLSQTGNSDSADAQVNFVYQTIYGNQQYLIGSGRAAEVRSGLQSSDPSATATVFCNDWEQPGVPHLDRRIAGAQAWFNQGCP
jgi:hypothetical protein